MRRFCVGLFSVLILICATLQSAWPQPVVPESGDAVQITDTDLASLLARSPEGSFMFDSYGKLHLVYTEKKCGGHQFRESGFNAVL